MKYSILSISVLLCSATAVSPLAEASSRFTLENDIDAKVKMYIYTGDDKACLVEQKTKSVPAGKTRSFGCAGQGKNQCRVTLFADGGGICKGKLDSCGGNAMRVKNKTTITVAHNGSGGYRCLISE
ncbi:MAG: hypothetical protein AAF642_07825 [Pseudomonadota bacterium]